MRQVLILSATLNFMLIGVVGWQMMQVPELPPLPHTSSGEVRVITRVVEQPPMRWSAINSQDTAQFIANLRNIDCPEATIRDLVTARFAANNSDHLSSETDATVTRLMEGTGEPEAKLATTQATHATRTLDKAALSAPLQQPVIMAEGQLPIELSEETLHTFLNLRDEFIRDFTKTGENPRDPKFRSRWQEAQEAFDSRLRAMLGWQAFAAVQALQAEAPDAAR